MNPCHFFNTDTTWCVLIKRHARDFGKDNCDKPMMTHAKRPAGCATQDSVTASGTAGGRFLLDCIHMNNKP